MPWPTVYINLKQYHLLSLMVVLYVYRYDGRGALADLRIHEPPPGGFDQRTILTEEELKIEQLCDEERYRSLYNNDVEESMYHGNIFFFWKRFDYLLIVIIVSYIYIIKTCLLQKKK